MSTEDHPFGGRSDVGLPSGGVTRVSRDPARLPSRPLDVPLHRYDDPLGEYRVWYAGQDEDTCITEVLATARGKPEADAVLASVIGVDDGYGQDQDIGVGAAEEPPLGGLPMYSKVDELRDVLRKLKVGKLHVLQDGDLADVSDPLVRSELGKDQRVRAAIQELDALVGNPKDRVSPLDGALIRLAGTVGRKISQAVSRAVYEQGYIGISYGGRWDDRKRCFAIFSNAKVTVVGIEPLSPVKEEHRAAVAKAAAIHDLALPPEWS